jgi:acyl carrier protein
MNAQELEARVLQIFLNIAADVDPQRLQRDVPFRDQFDFDSMDTLNFAIGLHKSFGIEVPETDYRELASLGSTVAYVNRQLLKGDRRADVRTPADDCAPRGG